MQARSDKVKKCIIIGHGVALCRRTCLATLLEGAKPMETATIERRTRMVAYMVLSGKIYLWVELQGRRPRMLSSVDGHSCTFRHPATCFFPKKNTTRERKISTET